MKFIYKPGIRLLVLFFAIGLQTTQAAEGNNTATLHYDPATDKLSITANEVSQMTLLRHLALKTGVEVSYDEQADHPVTIELTAVPLEYHVMVLICHCNDRSFAISVEVVPQC